MPRKDQKNEKTEKNEKEQQIQISSLEVLRVKAFDRYAFCDLKINGITIYGAKVVTYCKNGKDRDFLAMPSRKYIDGKGDERYMDIVHIPLSESDEQAICCAVWNMAE